MKRHMHLDDLLAKWAFDPATLNVRLIKGKDGRDVIQMRVDQHNPNGPYHPVLHGAIHDRESKPNP